MDMEQLILDELHALNKKVDTLGEKVSTSNTDIVERVAQLEVKSKDISGNGRPGRMKDAEDNIESLKRDRYWVVGWASGISGMIVLIFEAIRMKVGH
jgi:hypothetical protein